MIRLWCLAPLFLLVSTAAAQIPIAACADGQTKTVAILVRHADRDGEDINAKGQVRARALRDLVLGQFDHVDEAIYTDFARTRQTLEPIIDQEKERGREVIQLSRASHDYAGFADLIRAEHAAGHPLSVVVLAGHSNTIRPILELFRPDEIQTDQWFPCKGDLCTPDYDHLWTITLCGDSKPEIRMGTYGAPTPKQ